MTDEELVERFDIDIKALHAKIDALPESATKRRAGRLASILHRAAEEIAELAADDGMIQPFSGGETKPPGP